SAGLGAWAAFNRVLLPHVPPHCDQPYHLFYLLMPTLDDRQNLIAHLRAAGVTAAFHYVPLHLSEMGERFGGRPGDCPVTEAVSDRLVRLPFYNDLCREDQDRVIRAVHDWGGKSKLQICARSGVSSVSYNDREGLSRGDSM